MPLNSPGTIADTRVYAQNEQPSDERDGILWVDTSQAQRPMYVFSEANQAWESISPKTVYQQATEPAAPDIGDTWIDTDGSPITAYIWGGNSWVQQANQTDLDTSRNEALVMSWVI